jgi:aspartate-semialdehyde dehydrogenase
MKVAVVGCTGMVGQTMLKVLEERNFPVDQLIPVASERSLGNTINFRGKSYPVVLLQQGMEQGPDVALFSAGGSVSKEWGPLYAAKNCFVIDNSSAWRMDPGIKLIVPEINAHSLEETDKLISNPNCSTIQMVVALAPLHKAFRIKRLVISTYQSITGTGMNAVSQYEREKSGGGYAAENAYPHPIFANCLPHCDIFLDNGYTKEEMKLVYETRKILDDQDLMITSTAVRVPVLGGHSEAVNIEFFQEFEMAAVVDLLSETPGVVILDDPNRNIYPMPRKAHGKDEVFVGRIRRDESQPRSLNLWIVSDNLRKGAATNTIQIAEVLLEKGYLGE